MDYQMKLLVGEGDSRIEIDTVPQVMATASPVFRSMLQPDRFVEGHKLSQNKPFTVPFPEDDPAAMKVLCDILHFRTHMVPLKQMTSTLMAPIATVVDKYDCALAIQPWPKLWLLHVATPQTPWNVELMTISDLAMWIHISCHLGYEHRLRECTSSLMLNASQSDLSEDSRYGELPENVRDAVESAQNDCIVSFHKICVDLVAVLEKGQHCTTKKLGDQDDDNYKKIKFICSAIALGSAIIAASDICGGLDWRNIENWQKTPSYYYSAMLNFAQQLNSPSNVQHRYGQRFGQFLTHPDCSLFSRVTEQVQSIYARLKGGLHLSDVGNRAYKNNDWEA